VRGGRVVKGSCDDDDVDEEEVEVDEEGPGLCGEGGCARMCAWCG
jgi:hypothetical protein